MAISQVSIANSALVKVGADRISSLSEDTRAAILINAIFEQIRDQVLRDHPWNFAMTRAALAPNATEPAFEYDYTYDLPNDCLRVYRTFPDTIDYVVEGRTILTDEAETLYVQYIYRHEDPSAWSADFAEAFAWKLASEVAYPLTQSLALAGTCREEYKRVLAEARSIDGSEGILRGLQADVWTDARR